MNYIRAVATGLIDWAQLSEHETIEITNHIRHEAKQHQGVVVKGVRELEYNDHYGKMPTGRVHKLAAMRKGRDQGKGRKRRNRFDLVSSPREVCIQILNLPQRNPKR